ncbi:MAG TPA: thioesterase family protein [Solirubrobacteraceae bacterium]|nr:thioesterase family protein [Solirubrobacteraceae bacterium]
MTALPSSLYESEGQLFVPTALTRGPWDARFQHAGPPAALLARAVERAAGVVPGQAGRLAFDILRPVPLAPHRVTTRTLRPGRNVEQIEATLADAQSGDDLMRLNAWRLRTEELELPNGLGEPDPPPPPPSSGESSLPAFWTEPVAYHAALDWRFVDGEFDEPGPATTWTRLRVPLVAGEEVSPLERMLVMADAASGISHVLDWTEWVFINVELGIHLERLPEGEWMAMDATTRVGPSGAGLCTSVLSDERGRVGVSTQTLRVTPQR